jgi:hypothetical protein
LYSAILHKISGRINLFFRCAIPRKIDANDDTDWLSAVASENVMLKDCEVASDRGAVLCRSVRCRNNRKLDFPGRGQDRAPLCLEGLTADPAKSPRAACLIAGHLKGKGKRG